MQEALAGATGDGGPDLSVAELELGVGHRGRLGLHVRLGCLGPRLVLGESFLGNGRLLVEVGIALGVDNGFRGLGAGGGERGLRLQQRILERAAVERDQQVAGLNLITLLELQLCNDAIDL